MKNEQFLVSVIHARNLKCKLECWSVLGVFWCLPLTAKKLLNISVILLFENPSLNKITGKDISLLEEELIKSPSDKDFRS